MSAVTTGAIVTITAHQPTIRRKNFFGFCLNILILLQFVRLNETDFCVSHTPLGSYIDTHTKKLN